MSSLRTAERRALIDAFAHEHRLLHLHYEGETYTPGEMLEGLVLTESSGNPRARRYEPHQDRAGRTDAPTDPDLAGHDDGDVEDDASYGLAQVMGFNWRRLCGAPPKTRLKFQILYEPTVGLAAGCLILAGELAALYRESPTMPDAERIVRALARYNGGPTGDDVQPDGRMRLQAYVAKVAANAARARLDRRESGWREYP